MRKKRIIIKCGYCSHDNEIKPPRKYLKKTWFIVFCCGQCGKMNYVGYYFGKVKLVDFDPSELRKRNEH